ncbi:MAG: hypothetical protein HOO06_11295 [Bdellovibrionaceae bacterium]|jgi:predicted secreted acid phosphatase|nr:hypothetical protein [Pseudobdellovibrionaceae bacterium]
MYGPELFQLISKTAPKDTLVVLDLDSTLFNVGARTQALAVDFANNSSNQFKFPEECELLKNIQVNARHWGIAEPIAELKIRSEILFFDAVITHWQKYFFSNKFLKHDILSKGSQNFISSLLNRGNTIHYLTGRDTVRMGEGTVESLKLNKLPLDSTHKLFMKPIKGINDVEHKREQIKEFAKSFSNIWMIDNEPTILLDLEKTCPDVNLVFMNTVHSKKAESPLHMYTLDGHF